MLGHYTRFTNTEVDNLVLKAIEFNELSMINDVHYFLFLILSLFKITIISDTTLVKMLLKRL